MRQDINVQKLRVITYDAEFSKELHKMLSKNDDKNKLHWIDAEKKRPSAGQDIIFIDAIGMYRGIFHALGSGKVYIHGKKSDNIEWEDIYQWIEYYITLQI